MEEKTGARALVTILEKAIRVMRNREEPRGEEEDLVSQKHARVTFFVCSCLMCLQAACTGHKHHAARAGSPWLQVRAALHELHQADPHKGDGGGS